MGALCLLDSALDQARGLSDGQIVRRLKGRAERHHTPLSDGPERGREEKESAVTLRCIRVPGCVCALLVLSTSVMAGGWEHDFESALSRAQDSQQPLLIHFHAGWCGPCRSMERNVLNTAEVLSKLSTNIVGVKVETDGRRELVRRYGITTLPSDVIIAPDGKVIHRASGATSRAGYVAKLTRYGRAAHTSSPNGVVQSATRRTSGAMSRQPMLTQAVTESESGVAASAPSAVVPESEVVTSETSAAVRESTVAASESKVAMQDLEIEAEGWSAFDAEFTQIDSAEDPEPSFTTTLRRESGGRFGLDGYCPVSLSTESRWVRGVTEFQYKYQRVTYSLSTAAHLKMFTANPDKYIPYLHGCDPVALENDSRIQLGAIELGASYRKRAYFFASENNRASFLKTPEKFSAEQAVAFTE